MCPTDVFCSYYNHDHMLCECAHLATFLLCAAEIFFVIFLFMIYIVDLCKLFDYCSAFLMSLLMVYNSVVMILQQRSSGLQSYVCVVKMSRLQKSATRLVCINFSLWACGLQVSSVCTNLIGMLQLLLVCAGF